ncbi:MAG: HEPN domain-containing protein [Kosmotogaceae bacterium]
MTIENNDKRDLVSYRLDQADDTIEDVRILIENNRLRAAINRIYYGMFYSLLALGIKNEFETSKHAQLIGWFNKSFINKGLIDTKYGKIINKAFNRRTKGDYDVYIDFDKDTVIEMYNDMQYFIAKIKNYLDAD